MSETQKHFADEILPAKRGAMLSLFNALLSNKDGTAWNYCTTERDGSNFVLTFYVGAASVSGQDMARRLAEVEALEDAEKQIDVAARLAVLTELLGADSPATRRLASQDEES